MQNRIINDITSYIDFLRDLNFSVTVSCFDKVLEKHFPILYDYEVHLPAVCYYLKANAITCGKCPKNKRKLEKKTITEPYYSCCYAGIEEFVIPIIHDGTLICCVNVSGYRGKIPQSKILSNKYSKKLGNDFSNLYNMLKTDVPDMNTVLQAVKPLEYMFKALRKECMMSTNDGSTASQIYRKSLRYIYDNYMNDFSLEKMAKSLNYSPSYIRHTFLEQSGKTIHKTITAVRLNQAAVLLKSTDFTITRIALECGFCDGNYFSTVFKKAYNMTPKEYRKK
ncbi:MAG: helix-turn-helix transcriptional regulator [Acutalibacteraceae bacterium]